MKRQIYLIKVEANVNSNKFYLMEDEGNSTTFKATWGRVGQNGTSKEYPLKDWDKKYHEKIRKGYVDVTELKAENTNDVYEPIPDNIIDDLFKRLRNFANETIKKNYTISLGGVTSQMVNKAESLLNVLRFIQTTENSVEEFNGILNELFTVIPRVMSKVENYIAKDPSDFSDIYVRERKLLNTLKTSVILNEVPKGDKKVTILDELGLEVTNVTDEEMELIRRNLDSRINVMPKRAWRVINKKTQEKFDQYCTNNKINKDQIKLLWHGSGNENWLSILNLGLLIRPRFAAYTGSMFGDGLYFAPKASKSWGYTSYYGSCWKGGRSHTAFMGLFETAYGKPCFVDSCGNYNKQYIQKRECNCIHAKAGTSGLRNEEIIFYDTSQVTIKYLVEF